MTNALYSGKIGLSYAVENLFHWLLCASFERVSASRLPGPGARGGPVLQKAFAQSVWGPKSSSRAEWRAWLDRALRDLYFEQRTAEDFGTVWGKRLFWISIEIVLGQLGPSALSGVSACWEKQSL